MTSVLRWRLKLVPAELKPPIVPYNPRIRGWTPRAKNSNENKELRGKEQIKATAAPPLIYHRSVYCRITGEFSLADFLLAQINAFALPTDQATYSRSEAAAPVKKSNMWHTIDFLITRRTWSVTFYVSLGLGALGELTCTALEVDGWQWTCPPRGLPRRSIACDVSCLVMNMCNQDIISSFLLQQDLMRTGKLGAATV